MHRHLRILLINLVGLAIAFLLLTRVTQADVTEAGRAAAAVGMDAEVLAHIQERMREFVDAGQISGAVTLVARQGKVVHLEAVGEADIQSHRAMRTDSLFGIASMTKPITATAVMILQDDPADRLWQ